MHRSSAAARYRNRVDRNCSCGLLALGDPVFVTVRERHGTIDLLGIERPHEASC